MKESDTAQDTGTARMKPGRQRRNTLLFAASLAAVLAVLYLIQRMAVPKVDAGDDRSDAGLCAVIQIDGEKVHVMALDQDAEYQAADGEGHFNHIVIKDGYVSVKEADCSGQVCVNTGPIRNPGEVIACLPHRLIIYIEE